MNDVAADRTTALWSVVPAKRLARLLNIARRSVRASAARLDASGTTIAFSSDPAASAPVRDAAASLDAAVLCPQTHRQLARLVVVADGDRAWTQDERETLDEVAAALGDAWAAHHDAAMRPSDAREIRAASDGLRAPLQTIVGMTEFLKRETQPEMVAARADALQSIAASLLSALDGTAEPPAEESGAESFVTVRAFAEECLALLDPSDAVSVAEGVPTRAGFDSAGAKRALQSILSARAPGQISVEIVRSGNALRFNVSGPEIEGGPGLPTGRTSDGDAVEDVVHAFDGETGRSARPGGGTTMFFTAPAQWEASEFTAEVAHILVADDLDLNRKLISDMLSIEGHSVDSVADGASAVKAASERSYDLILMDMIMPGMDGVAATRAIRALPAPACRVPIVALTAHSLPEQLDSCLQAGMDATLTKPMTLDALIGAVETWTRRGRRAA